MKKIIFLILLFACISQTFLAQEKYAVLICGEPVTVTTVSDPDILYNTNTTGYYRWDEFWNDTYLMWEMLVFEKGYDDDNVIVVNNEAKGPHNFTLDMNGLPPGVYFCSVYVNGLLSDTKKMLAY